MYSYMKTIYPASGVEHCIACNFRSPTENNLVVAGANRLRVFRLHTKMCKIEDDAQQNQNNVKLEQVLEYMLFGNIQSLVSAKITGTTERDYLLLSFNDAKLSIIEYLPEHDDIRTVSLHQFEEDELRDGFRENIHLPGLRVDPENRCAGMLIYGSRLVIIPFVQNASNVDDTEDFGNENFPQDNSMKTTLSSYVIKLTDIDTHLINILDFQFMYGYNEPTVVFLYAHTQTWVGRITLRKDNVSLLAVSLNVNEKSNPVIWSMPNLPFDCYALVSVPRPIEGVLIVGANCFIHLKQGIPSYGVSLNIFTEGNTDFPLEILTNVVLALDNARITFLADYGEILAISTKDGDIYVVTLLTDEMRKVKKIHFEKAASSVLSTCLCTFNTNYLFLGSRLGNSLLLRCTPKTVIQSAPQPQPTVLVKQEPNESAQALSSLAYEDRGVSDMAIGTADEVDLEVYGTQTTCYQPSDQRLKSFAFEVCDNLINIAPISRIVMGQPTSLSEEFLERADPDLELVGAVGHSKNGALALLQRSIRPQVVTSFELSGCLDTWTLYGNEDEHHAFLLIAQKESTMVLQTGQDIQELGQDQSGFCVNQRTVFAGNLADGKYSIQVCTNSAFLLEGLNCIQTVNFREMNVTAVTCSMVHNFALVLFDVGSLLLLTFNIEKCKLEQSKLSMHSSNTPISCITTFKDTSNMFKLQTQHFTETNMPTTSTSMQQNSNLQLTRKLCNDVFNDDSDTEELLYGEKQPASSRFVDNNEQKYEMESEKVQFDSIFEQRDTYWCALCRQNGALEIYTLPDFQVVFYVRNFASAPKVLIDSGTLPANTPTGVPGESNLGGHEVKELLFATLDLEGQQPYLIALVEDDLLMYKAFPYRHVPTPNHLLARFSKQSHSILLVDKKSRVKQEIASTGAVELANGFIKNSPITARLRLFSHINNYAGIFICGLYPYWIFSSDKGCFYSHPLYIDGPIDCFAPFKNVNCPNGFIYFNRDGFLRLALLPGFLALDNTWPIRKLPLRCTAHFVDYHVESKTYVVALSNRMKGNILVRSTGEDTEEYETILRGPRFIYPTQEKFYLELHSPTNWEAVPNTRYELDHFEHVTALKALHLRSQERANGLKIFICIGTTTILGEDFAAKGRILIFDVIEVVPEPGKPLTKHKLKLLYDKEQIGPISALEQVDGLLFTCIGKKIFMWNFKDTKELIGVAFIDAEMYVHSVCSIKNYILIADLTKSIQLLQYREAHKCLALISKDPFPLRCYGVHFLIDSTQLGFLVTDASKNIYLFLYQPDDPESIGGTRLVRQGDIYLGSHVQSFFRVRCKPSVPADSLTYIMPGMAINEKRHVTFYATLDGSIGFILPLAEKTYRRLQTLQNKLVQCIPHTAGLNPKSYRLVHMPNRWQSQPQKNIVDGDLLWRYTQLSIKERSELAKQIGTSGAQIMEDLMDIELVTNFF